MSEEDKELLLKDLCARLPYGVKVLGPWKKDGPCELSEIDLTSSRQIRVFEDWFKIEEVKPYLRPMSSMTEEEKTEYFDMHVTGIDSWYIVDWLNKRYLDYHYFISKGLALEAPEGMYKNE